MKAEIGQDVLGLVIGEIGLLPRNSLDDLPDHLRTTSLYYVMWENLRSVERHRDDEPTI